MSHANKIEWTEADAVASMVGQSGVKLYEGKAGVRFRLTFVPDNHESYHYAHWSLVSGDERVSGSGGIWISKKSNAVFDYDGCFELPHQITAKLKSLGYDCSEL